MALQYSNVELRIYWGPEAGNYNVSAYANYYYLDNEERGIMASREHNILITQVQKSIPSGELVQALTFNHPVKSVSSNHLTLATPPNVETTVLA